MKRQHWQFDPEHTVSFGKHAGKKWKDVPSEYLEWFASNAYGQMINRRKWAILELKRRKSV